MENDALSPICLDDRYATTRLVCRATTCQEQGQKSSGGLRRRGYIKKSWPDKPLISVITVVLNQASTIHDAIISVVNQRYENVEFIIVDGGSKDGTLDVVKRCEHVIDYWISEPDSGVYDAMNKGAKIASGDWLYYLGSDDVLLNSLHNIAPWLRNENGVYYGDVYFSRRHRLYDGRFTAYKLMRRNICHQSIFYPKLLFKKHSFNLKYRIASDYDLNLRTFNDQIFKYIYMPILVAVFNETNLLSANIRDVAFEQDLPKILNQHLGRLLACQYRVRQVLKAFERKVIRKIAHSLRSSKKSRQ